MPRTGKRRSIKVPRRFVTRSSRLNRSGVRISQLLDDFSQTLYGRLYTEARRGGR